ncbi:isochorismatase family protein [Glycomyces arizonensis]|uniref:isochorismatase family protein n=1 Tax=Glycomyces arizonensis TaxID=256035 RepID=UPI00047C21DF|nr:isochorismatase family protein [Glycomyces arizonensis]
MTQLDPARTALVLIDLMPRIVGQPLAPRPGSAVVDAALTLAAASREAGAPVVAVRVERPGVAEQPPGSELVEAVAAVADEIVVKRSIGGFYGTGLHESLQRRGVDTLAFAGIATNLGVESTARAASDHGYELVFVEDAMAAVTIEEHQAAVTLDFPRFGEVTTCAELQWRKDADAA